MSSNNTRNSHLTMFNLRINLRDFLCLVTCGVLIGVTLNFISKEEKTQAITLQDEILSSIELFQKIKILCIVLTTESHHKTKAIPVKNTWGSRCNKLIFASNVTDSELGSLNFQHPDGFGLLWNKTKHAFSYAYENYRNDYDWFYKADDDTYAILDNMRYMLSTYSPNDPIYFGKKFRFPGEHEYFLGGSGYVMGKKALKKFVTEGLPDKNKCRQEADGSEDWEMGICMRNIGVHHGDARDEFQRETFLPSRPEVHLFSLSSYWYFERLYYPNVEGLDCCSNYTISFHSVPPEMMYAFDYLLFNLQAYGVQHAYVSMPQKKNFTAVVQKLVAEVKKTKANR